VPIVELAPTLTLLWQNAPVRTVSRLTLWSHFNRVFPKYSAPKWGSIYVVMMFAESRLDPVPGMLWVINTLDEWPLPYIQYHPVHPIPFQMVSETPSQLGEVPMAIGECLLQPPTAQPGIQPVLGLVPHSSLRPAQPGIQPVLDLKPHSGLRPWLIVGLDPPCMRPTAFAYTVLTCSQLRGKAIGSKGHCQCHYSRFGWPYQLTSLASPCQPCPNDF